MKPGGIFLNLDIKRFFRVLVSSVLIEVRCDTTRRRITGYTFAPRDTYLREHGVDINCRARIHFGDRKNK